MWSGFISTIPQGFALCDGANGTPDLRNRFAVGAGSDAGGGYLPNITEIGSGLFRPGDHGGQGMHQLTIAEMPSHNHLYYFGANPGYPFVFDGVTSDGNTSTPYSWVERRTQNTGGNQPHNIMPPYYSLAYIMKQ